MVALSFYGLGGCKGVVRLFLVVAKGFKGVLGGLLYQVVQVVTPGIGWCFGLFQRSC